MYEGKDKVVPVLS